LWLEALVQHIGGEYRMERLLLLKLVAVGAHLVNSWLIWLLLGNRPSRQRLTGTLLYAWNPLILLETAGNGHNDATMMAFVVLSLYLVQRRHCYGVLPCLMLAVLIKPVALLWTPFFLVLMIRQLGFNRRGLSILGIGGLLALGVAALAYAPLWAGADTFLGLRSQDSIRGLSLPLSLILSWQALVPTDWLAELAEPAVRALTWLFLGIVYLCQLKRVVSFKTLAKACFWTGLAYVFVVNLQPQAWYLIWLFPFAILANSRVTLLIALALSVALFLPYVPFLWVLAAQPLSGAVSVALLLAAFACLALALILIFRRPKQPM
jgi:hypothetical protein